MSGLDVSPTRGSVTGQRDVSANGAPSESSGAATSAPRAKAIKYFRQALFMRRQRDKRFGQDFSTDRGWDLLLLLMIARLEERTMNAGILFRDESVHVVSLEELDRQIGFGNVILMDAGDDLERSQIVLSDEAARHLIDLFRIDSAAE